MHIEHVCVCAGSHSCVVFCLFVDRTGDSCFQKKSETACELAVIVVAVLVVALSTKRNNFIHLFNADMQAQKKDKNMNMHLYQA